MELSTIATLISVSLALATFFIGRISASHLAGKESGSLVTDIKYIKESITRIERRVDCDIGKLEDRADEVSIQIATLGKEVSRSVEASHSAHRRLDDHLVREHGSLKQ
ncbi:MAG: hypothetical protein ACOX0K_03305 [Oscillospiraceae bacterium]|jgi:hypothetical protein